MTAGTNQLHASTGDETREVLELLERQRDLYRDLKSLSDQQDELISAGATERLLSLLADRQRLVDDLGQVSASIAPYRGRIAAIADQAAGDLGATMRGLVEEVRGLLESIIEQDEKGRADLSAARDRVAGQVRHAAAPSVKSAYGGASSPKPSPRFTEQRG